MSPDDDWALGQNEVDVRNEARRAAMFEFVVEKIGRDLALDEAVYGCVIVKDGKRIDPQSVFACRNPEQVWIDESRTEAEREDKS